MYRFWLGYHRCPLSRLPATLALALLAACGAAIWIQDHTGALPLGLFNAGRETYARLSDAAALAVLLGIALCAAQLGRGRALRGAGWLAGALAAAVLLELAVGALDCGLVSRSPGSRLGGPYWEHPGVDGRPVFLKKGTAPLGFRSPEPYTPRPDRPRLLFLGDSYVEGSGSDFPCNYPQVVEAELSRLLGRSVQVMSAGVAGYGPVDAANLLDLLVADGWEFDAVVYHLFPENDFSDNLPHTERRVVAGINFRFPQSRFLRAFHPLNTRTFRYAVFVGTAASLSVPERNMAVRIEGACRQELEPLREVSAGLRTLVERRFEANHGMERRLAEDEVRSALERMRARANERGVPFVVVVFPERIRVDPDLQRLLPLPPWARDLDHLTTWVGRELPGVPRLDLTPALEGESGWYRTRDTHLSDAGNVRAGRAAAERLAALCVLGGDDWPITAE